MAKMNKVVILSIMIILIFSASCVNENTPKQKEYEKCTSVCASVLSDDFVTLELCRRECKKEFLDEK
ncbi:hypothetical protein ACFLUF_02170 [Chloroflexota bacterium]